MSSSASSVVSNGAYAPSPNTCSQALIRANQLRIQALIRQLAIAADSRQHESGLGESEVVSNRLNTLRVLRKTLREFDYKLSWLTQIDFFETIQRLITSEQSNSPRNEANDWRLINDCTQLLIESIPRFSFDLDQQTIEQLFPIIIENFGHQRSEIRRSSLLLMNMYLNERPQHFQLILKLFIEYGLRNDRNYQIQRGAILSLPLLMTEQVVENENLLPLVKCLSELLVSDDSKSQALFYSLYLALQRLQLTIGQEKFSRYLSKCSREARILYEQAASRNNSLITDQFNDQLNLNLNSKQSNSNEIENETSEANSLKLRQDDQIEEPVLSHSGKQVKFENNSERINDNDDLQEINKIETTTTNQTAADANFRPRSFSRSSQELTTTDEDERDSDTVAAHHHVSIKTSNFDQSDVSSTCSSQANLVEPAHYMSEAALKGKPLANLEQLHHFDHSNIGLTINDINVSNSPTVEFGPMGSNLINSTTNNGLKFGIFPKHLINVSLNGHNYLNRLEALEEIMCIIRDSPINHLAILMTYFDSFLKQFLVKLMETSGNNSSAIKANTAGSIVSGSRGVAGDYKIELIVIDIIETIVIKTKLSTIQYVRPMVGLLVKCLSDSRLIFRDNTIRVLHKMMAYLPPQHVIDAIFEHKHSKSVLVREEAINRVTAAVLEYNKNEFNLTKLCYHVLPMLADFHAQVRLAALECLAVLANALGQERIGSLLTAAGAVQTGCDYDGLLDAINARLMRKKLPACNSDGSIRHVLKPLLNASHYYEHQSADVRWIMEAPSSHQHVGGPAAQPVQEQPSDGADASVHHAHRPGAYSPPEPVLQARRASLAVACPAGLSDSNERLHHHHRAHHSKQRRPSISKGRNNNYSPTQRTKLAGQEDKGVSGKEVPGQAEYADLGQGSGRGEKLQQQQKSEIGQRQKTSSLEEASSENRESTNRKRANKRQIGTGGNGPGRTRSSSQESSASTDTNKVLFQYYLRKFKQSLSDETNPDAFDQLMDSPAGMAKQARAKNNGRSDSIIYSDSIQAYLTLTNQQSRFQQTSFDYDSDSVGRAPASVDRRQRGTVLKSQEKDVMSSAKNSIEDLKRRHGSGSEQPEASNSSGEESPAFVMNGGQVELAESARNAASTSRQRQQQDDSVNENHERKSNSVEGREANERSVGRRPSISRRDSKSLRQGGQIESAAQLDSQEPDGAQTDRKQQSSKARRHQLQRSHATLDSPTLLNQADSLPFQQATALDSDETQNRIGLSSRQASQDAESATSRPEAGSGKQREVEEEGRLSDKQPTSTAKSESFGKQRSVESASSPDSKSNAGSEELGSNVGTQTSNRDNLSEEQNPRVGDNLSHSRRESRRSRRSSNFQRANDSSRDSTNEERPPTDGAPRQDIKHENQAERIRSQEEASRIRKRNSRSQPPPQQHNQSRQFNAERSSSKSNLIGSESQQRNFILNNNDLKRSISVSPSLANSNINIRHILENVAEIEGPFQEPQLAFKVSINALESTSWSTKVEGILALIRLVNHHQQLIINHLHEIILRLSNEIKNLRSTVARSAIFALAELGLRLRRFVEPDLDLIVQSLLNKSVENNGFIRDDIRRAFNCLIESIVHWKLATSLLQHGSAHKNQIVRRISSQFISKLVDLMGPAKCLVGSREISSMLIPAAAKFAQDNSPQTRYYGRFILYKLMQHGAFDRLMRKTLAPSLYKSTIGILESIKRRGPGEPPIEL